MLPGHAHFALGQLQFHLPDLPGRTNAKNACIQISILHLPVMTLSMSSAPDEPDRQAGVDARNRPAKALWFAPTTPWPDGRRVVWSGTAEAALICLYTLGDFEVCHRAAARNTPLTGPGC